MKKAPTFKQVQEDSKEQVQTSSKARSGSFTQSRESESKNLPEHITEQKTSNKIATSTNIPSGTTSISSKPPTTGLQSAIANAYAIKQGQTSSSQSEEISKQLTSTTSKATSAIQSTKNYENPYINEKEIYSDSLESPIPPPRIEDPNIAQLKKQCSQSEQKLKELGAALQQKEQQLREIDIELSENKQKNLEQKNDIKQNKSKITSLEKEVQHLTLQLQEKDDIIAQYLETIKNQPYEVKRCFLQTSQIIKQRRYTQHLTKILKSYKALAFEIEYQLNATLSVLEKDANAGGGEKSVNMSEKYLRIFTNFKEKLIETNKLSGYQFSSNIFKEYDKSSGQELSDKVAVVQLESKASKLLMSVKGLIQNQKEVGNTNANSLIKFYQIVEELAYSCTQLGFDVNFSEDQFEKPLSIKEIIQNSRKSFEQKIQSDESAIFSQLMDRNSTILQQCEETYIDARELVAKFRDKTLFDAVFMRYDNLENSFLSMTSGVISNVSSVHQESNMTPNKNAGKGISNTPARSTKHQQNQAYAQNFINSLRVALSNTAFLTEKKMNIIFACMVSSQVNTQRLKNLGNDLFKNIENTLIKFVKDPFDDLMQIYEKYYQQEKNQNYPVHLAQVFNLHGEKIYRALSEIVKSQFEVGSINLIQKNDPLLNLFFSQFNNPQ